MGAVISKATAQMSATMIAAFAPKLHNEMKASVENILTNNVSVDPVIKAFSENYLSATNEQTDNRQYVSVGVGGGAIAMLAMILTGPVWLPLVMILATCALVAVSVKKFWSVSEFGDQAVLALPSQKGDDIDNVQDEETLSRVMTTFLKISSGDVAIFKEDSACCGIADYIASVVKFQLEYRKVTYFLAGGECTEKISAAGGQQLPEHLQNLSLQEFGERLHDQMADFSEDWAKSFRVVNSSLNSLDGVQALMDMHGRSNQRKEKVDEDKIKRILKLDNFDKAIQTLTSKHASALVKDARVFLHCVGKHNPTIAKVQHQVEELQKIQDDLQGLHKESKKMANELAVMKGREVTLNTQGQNIKAAKSGNEEHLRYLEKKLEAAKANLDAARRDEKSYTWWMFGARSYVWENDVKLAKEKVKSYSDEEDILTKRIGSLKNGSDEVVKALNGDEEDNIGNQRQLVEEISDLQNTIQKHESKILAQETTANDLEKKIKTQLETDGCVSVKHLLRANHVLNQFAHCAERASAVEKSVRADWAETLNEIKDLADYLAEAQSFGEQKQLLWQLRKVINAKKVPMLNFVKQARAPPTLAPGPNKTYGLEDAEPSTHHTNEAAKPCLLVD